MAFLPVTVVRYMGVTFTPSEPPTSGIVSKSKGRRSRSPRWGLNAEVGSPPPPVSMVLSPVGRDNYRVEIRANLSRPSNGPIGMARHPSPNGAPSFSRYIFSTSLLPPHF